MAATPSSTPTRGTDGPFEQTSRPNSPLAHIGSGTAAKVAPGRSEPELRGSAGDEPASGPECTHLASGHVERGHLGSGHPESRHFPSGNPENRHLASGNPESVHPECEHRADRHLADGQPERGQPERGQLEEEGAARLRGAAGQGIVLVTSRSFSSGVQDLVGELAAAGLDVVRGPATHDLNALREPLSQAVGWIAGTGPITAEHLAQAPQLRVLARYGVGVDAVDLTAAAERGVVVTNTPGANSNAVADHALARLRDVAGGDRRVRSGDWTVRRSRELGSLTVGLLGFGRIGQGVARRLAGFGATVLAHDPFLDAEAIRAAGAEPVTADELPARCDAVSLHAPGGRCVVDADWLDRARDGLILVNTARADLVDEAAVAAALRAGRLGGYAADTLAGESSGTAGPLLADDLAELVLITPHTGAQTVEAVDRMGASATADLLAVLSGADPTHPVRTPEEK